MHDRGGYEDRETLRAQINALTDELDRLRERVSSHPHDIAMLERRLADARSDARTTASNNERLAATLREARDQIISLKSEVDRLAQPPASFGVFLAPAEEHTADIYTSGPQDAGQRQP
jgi:proteasome-associated ATPase